ncbi:MAG: gamma-glutamyl-gamma-aminobutyrate hydrolase family protein [Pirellulales bacterium]|nr:gamma-glutamyl-gamma-aminobutyrate hydrolase family protein [Pirellulales bacterium]|tara:strand:- start:1414 stop:2163 length:750 start_codon:yes stop_codon:yes gene_type:complete
MQRKPLIGLNADYKSATKDIPGFSYLAEGYADCILKAGGIPVVLPLLDDIEDLKEVLDSLDGFMLIGGMDLDARNDGFMLHPSMRLMEKRREDFDRMLCDEIVRRRMPVFGIGCGMQLLNLSAGGNLHFHLPEDIPGSVPHRDFQDPSHRHGLEITEGSLLERVYGDGEIRVSSNHHMAVDEVADDFVVTARCPDGVIEAIESQHKKWFAIGTQFHPETPAATALDFRIVEEFVDGVKNGVGGLQLMAA